MEKIYNPDFCTKIQYLENAKKYTASISKTSYDLLGIAPRQTVLEFGCGGGYDVFEMAKLVGESGKVYGVDIDKETIEYVKTINTFSNVSFEQNLSETLRFEANTFDRIRAERVLQHVPNAEHTLEDLVRVLKPNGKIGIIETDWESLCFFSTLPEIEKKIVKFITQVVSANALVARKVGSLFVKQGLTVKQSITSYNMYEYEKADAFIVLNSIIEKAVAMNYLTTEEQEEWLSVSQKRNQKGLFVMQLNFLIIVGENKFYS